MSAARVKILVIDGDATSRELMRAALRKAGFDVSLAEDGEAGLRAFLSGTFDMVMLDVDMPGMSGHEVCRTLRAAADPLLPIVMVTGKDDVASVEHAYQAGATDFIAKPINWAMLGHRVKYLLRGQQSLQALRNADARTSAILRAIPDLLFELDSDGRFVDYHSPRSDLLFTPPENFIGKTVSEVMPAAVAPICMAALQGAADTGSSSGQQYELQLPHGRFWFELSVSRKDNAPGEKPNFIVLSRDITERKEAEQKIARLAFFDGLTGLPNRLSFVERVDREIGRAKRAGGKLGVLFMDLDGFKAINDLHGPNVGDALLQIVAARLKRAVRVHDMVSRLGDDAFACLLHGSISPQHLARLAGKLGDAVAAPVQIGALTLAVRASVGLARCPDDARSAEALLQRADAARRQAKARAKRQVVGDEGGERRAGDEGGECNDWLRLSALDAGVTPAPAGANYKVDGTADLNGTESRAAGG